MPRARCMAHLDALKRAHIKPNTHTHAGTSHARSLSPLSLLGPADGGLDCSCSGSPLPTSSSAVLLSRPTAEQANTPRLSHLSLSLALFTTSHSASDGAADAAASATATTATAAAAAAAGESVSFLVPDLICRRGCRVDRLVEAWQCLNLGLAFQVTCFIESGWRHIRLICQLLPTRPAL